MPRATRERVLLVIILLAGWWPASVSAQGALSLDVGATHSIPPSGVSGSAATYVTLGASLDAAVGPTVGLFGSLLGGLATVEDRGNWLSVMGGTQLFGQVSRSIILGVTASGRLSWVGAPERSRSALLEAVPEMQVFFGRVGLRAFGTGGFGESGFTVSRPVIRDTRFGPRVFWVDREFTQDLWAYGGGVEVFLPVGPAMPFVGASAQRSPRGGFAAAGGGVTLVFGRALLGTELKYWDTPFGSEVEFTASLQIGSFGIVRGAILGGRYGPDPLLDAPPATMGAATASFDVIRFGREPAPLATVGGADEPVRLQLQAEAGTVTVLGDFTGWEEIALSQEDDVWSIGLVIPPGVYRFGFMVDGTWYVPQDAVAGTDEWGREEAVLVVPEPEE